MTQRDEPAERARPPKQSPTIYDVAELAGVNPSTVSRALSKPGRISAKTEKLIQDAAKAVNYRVNPMARALPTGRTSTLGLIIADVTNPVFFNVIRGAEHAASEAGYTLVLAESQESGELEVETTERVAPSVDALVLVATRLTDQQLRTLSLRKPLVVINRRIEGVTAIVPSIESGIEQALDHLAELGHTSVAYLCGPSDSWMDGARRRVVQAKAPGKGMTMVEVGPGAPTLEGGEAAYQSVIDSHASAVLAYNDLMAIGLLQAAHKRRDTVPGRLSIIGFDDIFGSDFTSPPLTTIRTPLRLMGELAVRHALELVGTGVHGASAALSADLPPLTTELVVRGSTGPVGREPRGPLREPLRGGAANEI